MLTTAEVARRLGVSSHEVRRLLERGELTGEKRGVWLVDDPSVQRRAQQAPARGRPLAARTAWAALWEVSGLRAEWLEASSRSRLRTWLRSADAQKVALACRRRADRRDLRVLAAYRQELVEAEGVVPGGVTAAAAGAVGLLLMGDTQVEIYSDRVTTDRLTRELGLSDQGEPNLTVRVPNWLELATLGRRDMPSAVVAVDLMEASDVRTRRAGHELMTSLLKRDLGAGE